MKKTKRKLNIERTAYVVIIITSIITILRTTHFIALMLANFTMYVAIMLLCVCMHEKRRG